MIGSLKGKIIFIHEDYILLEVGGGVGYMVHLPPRDISPLNIGDALFLYIHTHVREDAITLYGFTSHTQQSLFLLLTSVQGVGSKMALNVLSTFAPDEIRDIIIAQDMNSLTRANGIGKRLAERIVGELKNKITTIERIFIQENTDMENAVIQNSSEKKIEPLAESTEKLSTKTKAKNISPSSPKSPNFIADATSALENLGYSKVDSMRAATSAKSDGAQTLSEIITGALRLLN